MVPDFLGKDCDVGDTCGMSALTGNPCSNDGICTNLDTFKEVDMGGGILVKSSHFECTCSDDFQGDLCEIVDPCFEVPCQNGAVCTPEADFSDYSCDCTGTSLAPGMVPDFLGKDCDVGDTCGMSALTGNPCSNDGICTNLDTFTEVDMGGGISMKSSHFECTC